MNYPREFGNNNPVVTINILRNTGSLAINAEHADIVSDSINHAIRYTAKPVILDFTYLQFYTHKFLETLFSNLVYAHSDSVIYDRIKLRGLREGGYIYMQSVMRKARELKTSSPEKDALLETSLLKR